MKINSIDDVATIAMEPYQALRNPHIRHLHYMRNYLDTPEQFLVGYHKGTLVFSNQIPENEIVKYEKLFRNYAKAKTLDSRGQETRLNAIIKRFGKQGETAAMKLFEDCHKNKKTGKKQRNSKDYLYIWLSDADRQRLLEAQETNDKSGMTENQFARLLLERELKRLFPETQAQEIRRAEP